MVRLPRLLPRGVAFELVATGGTLDAERAHAFGLVSRLAPPNQALPEARKLGEQIAANAPLAVQASKRIMAMTESMSIPDALLAQRDQVAAVRASEDAQEGTSAFLEKRPPQWRSR
jgi:enoyl-CoA hydratase